MNSCETKPIRRVARCLGGQLYKQSQFGVFSSHKGCHCEQTNPICTRREESVGQAPPYRWLNCAKQSQFRRRRQEGQRLGQKGVMVNMTSDGPRQNKANSAGRDAPGRTARGLLLGHDAPNKPNFRLRRADEAWGTGAVGCCPNKANFRRSFKCQVSSVKLETPCRRAGVSVQSSRRVGVRREQ